MIQNAMSVNLITFCRELNTSTCTARWQTPGARIQGNENAMTKDLNKIRTGSKRTENNC